MARSPLLRRFQALAQDFEVIGSDRRPERTRTYAERCHCCDAEAPAERLPSSSRERRYKPPLSAVESPARRQRRLARHLGEVLVQEHAGDELLPRGNAEQ